MTRVEALKSLDRVIGRLLCALLPPPRRSALGGRAPRSALFIRPGGIGDAVLLLPAIERFAAAFPECAVDILAERRNCAIFSLAPQVRRVYCYDAPGAGWGSAFRRRYDVVIDTEQWYRLSAVVARLALAPRVVGFGTNERAKLFTDPVPYDRKAYEGESFLALLAPFGIPSSRIEAPFVTIPPAALAEANRQLAPLSGRPYAVIFPGASIPEKRWGTEKFREVAEGVARLGLAVVVIGGKGDVEGGGEVLRGVTGINLAGRTSLAVAGALLVQAKVLVGGDSGVMHLAYAVGTPTVSIFGPSDPAKWGPRGERSRVISRSLPCAPCSSFGSTPPCPRGSLCLAEIGAAEVLRACQELLV